MPICGHQSATCYAQARSEQDLCLGALAALDAVLAALCAWRHDCFLAPSSRSGWLLAGCWLAAGCLAAGWMAGWLAGWLAGTAAARAWLATRSSKSGVSRSPAQPPAAGAGAVWENSPRVFLTQRRRACNRRRGKWRVLLARSPFPHFSSADLEGFNDSAGTEPEQSSDCSSSTRI